jgi:hypothetical protein
MAVTSRTLPVPYFTQPTGITCQSTVLKMMASYLEREVVQQSTGAADRAIQDIWTDINKSPDRPVKLRNAHANMKWWLERHFPSLAFEYMQTKREDVAADAIVRFIDAGYPVLVSVSHARVAGHIVLVIGYRNYQPNVSSADFELIVHDPFGQFDPFLLSNAYGKRRWTGGASLVEGGQSGPGREVPLPLTGVSRRRNEDARAGNYELLSVIP